MRLITWILQMSRLFVALTLIAGTICPVYAGLEAAQPSSYYKDVAAVQPIKANMLLQNAKTLPAGSLKVPMYFEKNHGQTDASVKFFTRAAGYNLYLTSSEAVTVLPRAGTDKIQSPLVVRMKLKGANANPSILGLDIMPGRTSYFLGSDSSKWQAGVEQYARVKLSQVYPGIDMVYRFDNGKVEYDFLVAPGANPARILLSFQGSKSLRLDAAGNLVLGVEGGELTYKAPKLYQMIGDKKVSVTGSFVLASNKNASFEVGDYIKSKELVIDPAIAYGTYLGGSVDDAITSIAVDGSQQAYVTGWANSAMTGAGGFPASTNAVSAPGPDNGAKDVFVAKLSADGSTLIWLAWLGGALADQANGIALDKSSVSTPKVFITGVTSSSGLGTSFPLAGPALQTCATNTGSLAFVAELTQPGNIPALVYSTCWGGVSGILTNTANAIAVDSLGAAYITGTTFASNFPISAGIAAPYNTMGAASEAGFVVKIAPAGASVVYSMLLGTSDTVTNSNAIAVDSLGKAWVAGKTTSDTWPAAALSGHFSELRTAGVWPDAFVAQVKADGTSLLYATYINGATADEATAIVLNKSGVAPYNVFVAGWTVSPTDFPSTAYLLLPTVGPGSRPVPYQKTLQGADDAFILRLNPFEAAADRSLEMVYATHVGAANGADRAFSIALDDLDDAYIAGWTRSSNWTVAGNDTLVDCSLPCVSRNVAGAVQTNTSSDQAAFVAAIGPAGLTRPFFSYLGASPGTFDKQRANGIAIDALHNIYVAGTTPSNTFPATTGSLMDGSAGTELLNGTGTENATDGFVTKIAPVTSFGSPLPSACTISSISPITGFSVGGDTVTINGTDLYGFSVSSVTFDGIAVSSYTQYASSTMITAVTPRHPLTGTLTAGSVFLTLTNSTGSCSVSYAYTVPGASCSITGISPVSGFTTGGDTVTITGSGLFGFSVSTHVAFDGIASQSYSVNATSTVVTAVTPRHPLTGALTAGSVLLTLATSSGTCSASYAYTTPGASCTITGISPVSGFTTGGDTVTITGSGLFGFSVSTHVAFDGIASQSYSVNATSTVVTAVTPRHPLTGALTAGSVLLTLATSSGTCSASYAYLAPVVVASCTISGISPTHGFTLGGTTVTITGTGLYGFSGAGSVAFDLLAAQSYTVNATSTVVTAVAPRHPLTGTLVPGSVFLRLATSSGTCTAAYNYDVSPVAATGACGDDFFYPSPATGDTGSFAYCMAMAGRVDIRVYNVIGDLAVKIADSKAAGAQISSINTARLAPGVYLYRLEKNYDDGTSTKSTVKKFAVKH